MTDKIWTDLYGKGVNVQRRAIHCCSITNFSITNSQPRRVVHENSEFIWWFPTTDMNDPCVENFDGFPAFCEEAVVIVTNYRTFLGSELNSIFHPLLDAMETTLLSYKKDVEKIKGNNGYRLRRFLHFLNLFVLCIFWLGSGLLISLVVYGDIAPIHLGWLVLWPLTFLCHYRIMIKPKILLGKCRETFWAQIHALVISFNSQAAEYETEMDFLQDLVGPVDPSHPKNTRYKGPDIVI